jgi:hypothetical protein
MAMSDNELPAPLGRAIHMLRQAPEPGWDAMQDRVIHAVRATPRAGWPLRVVDPAPGSAPGTIWVSDLALKTAILDALRDDADTAVSFIDVRVEDADLRSVRIELTGRYGADLNAAAQRVHTVCQHVLADAVGHAEPIPVEIVLNDVAP